MPEYNSSVTWKYDHFHRQKDEYLPTQNEPEKPVYFFPQKFEQSLTFHWSPYKVEILIQAPFCNPGKSVYLLLPSPDEIHRQQY